MHVLVTWASRRGGTEGIARIVADALRAGGHEVTEHPAGELGRVIAYDAVVVGSGLYANRWLPAARRFVARNEPFLRTVPTWFFSSGPLDDSPTRAAIAPVRQVSSAMDRVGALGHVTFGGRLEPDAKGLVAHAMAKKHAGDWRDAAQIGAWASEVARRLPDARPRAAVTPPGGSVARLAAHGVIGWLASAATALALAHARPAWLAHAAYDLLVCAIFAVVAFHYFKPRGALGPGVAAAGFAAIFALLELGLVRYLGAFWIPLVAIILITTAIGMVASMAPGAPRPAHA